VLNLGVGSPVCELIAQLRITVNDDDIDPVDRLVRDYTAKASQACRSALTVQEASQTTPDEAVPCTSAAATGPSSRAIQ
jgi:hypothetical protein